MTTTMKVSFGIISLFLIATSGCFLKPDKKRTDQQSVMPAEVNDLSKAGSLERERNMDAEQALEDLNCDQANFTDYTFENSVVPLVKKYCSKCHMDMNQQGGVSFDTFLGQSDIDSQTFFWYKVEENILTERMPPDGNEKVDKCSQLAYSAWMGMRSDHEVNVSLQLRLRSPSQYDLAISELLQEPFNEAEKSINYIDSDTTFFDTEQKNQSVNGERFSIYRSLAEKVGDKFNGKQLYKSYLSENCINNMDSISESCLNELIQGVAKKLTGYEIEEAGEISQSLISQSELSATAKIETAVAILLLHPQFIYRIEGARELGQEIPALDYLNRISHLLWGLPPDKKHIDLVGNKAASEIDFEKIVDEMLADAKTANHLQVFFSQWFNYRKFKFAENALHKELFEESKNLVKEVFENGGDSLLDIISYEKGYMSSALSKHYGAKYVPQVESAGIVDLSEPRGLLHHGAVLADKTDFTKASVTARGKFLAESILCSKIPPPPPVNIDDLKAQVEQECQIDTILQIGNTPGCGECHKLMDNIGLGLFVHGPLGAIRETELGKENCKIDHAGELEKYGKFLGASELSESIKNNANSFARCAVQQVIAYSEHKNTFNVFQQEIDTYMDEFEKSNYSFRQLLKEMALSERFKRNSFRD